MCLSVALGDLDASGIRRPGSIRQVIHRASYLLAMLGAVVGLVGCSSVVAGHGVLGRQPAPTGPTGFPSAGPRSGAVTSPDGDFSVTLPSGWRDETSSASRFGAVTVYIGPAADGFATNINVVREVVGGMTVQDYVQRTLASVRARFHATVVSPPTPGSVDGDEALEYTLDDEQAGKSLRQRQTLVVHDGSGYVITYSALRSAFDASSDDAAALVASWQWG